jgi:hypothetical protein
VKLRAGIADAVAMPHDFVPREDADLSAWAEHFGARAYEFLLLTGADPSPALDVQALALQFSADLAAARAARDAAKAATTTKNASRASLERAARQLAALIQAMPLTTNANRADMGLTVRGAAPGPVAGGTPAPHVSVEQDARFTHRLRFVPSETSPARRKPRGVLGAEVYVALTEPGAPAPVDEASYRYVRTITRDGVRLSFEPAHAGKTAHYRCRWLGTTGDVSAWGGGVSATVAA